MEQLTIFDMMYPTFKIGNPVRLIELFSGIGAQAMAMEALGVPFERYRTCEWDINAIASYKAIHCADDDTDYSKGYTDKEITEILVNLGISTDGKNALTEEQIKRIGEPKRREIYNNIRATHNLVNIMQTKGCNLGIDNVESFTYLLTYSFPCTDLSVAGKQKGMKKGSGTRSGLLWEVERLLTEVENLPQVLLMENVPQVVSEANIDDFHGWCRFLERKGYKNYTQVLNAKDYGVAQNRKRCFMVSILGDYNYHFPEPIPLKLRMKDILEDEVSEKYYLKNEKANKLIQTLIENGTLSTPPETGYVLMEQSTIRGKSTRQTVSAQNMTVEYQNERKSECVCEQEQNR